jgi:hypothetical protein
MSPPHSPAYSNTANSSAVAWLQNTNNTFVKQNASLPAAQRAALVPIEALNVTLPGPFLSGRYSALWVNTTTGQVLQQQTAICEPPASATATRSLSDTCQQLKLTAPTFVTDVALFINRTAGLGDPDPVVPDNVMAAFALTLLNGSTFRYEG